MQYFMRVTHVISNINIGGAEKSLCMLVEAQSGMGIGHTVISMLSGGALLPRLKAAGANVIELGMDRSIKSAAKLLQVGRAIRQTQPDLVQSWMYHANIAAAVARMLGYYKSPLIWGVRQSATKLSDDVPLTRLLILSGALFSPFARRVVYNSEVAAETHESLRYPKTKRVIIPNGIDCNFFRPLPGAREQLLSELGAPNDAILIGRVARYAPMKDFPTLFRTFARIHSVEPRARLILIGHGLVRENEALIQDWAAGGAPTPVHFLGQRTDIERLYPALDVLVSPSRSNESFPNVVYEAIACGCPVVSTDVGNSANIRELQALVVPPGDVEVLSSAVVRVLHMSPEVKQRFVQTARVYLEHRFGPQAYARQFLRVWESECWLSGRSR